MRGPSGAAREKTRPDSPVSPVSGRPDMASATPARADNRTLESVLRVNGERACERERREVEGASVQARGESANQVCARGAGRLGLVRSLLLLHARHTRRVSAWNDLTRGSVCAGIPRTHT
eukprot:159519-Rhodomonas_salina.2